MPGIMDRANALARAGDEDGAKRLVEEASETGDGEALLALGQWRMLGMYGSRDIAAARRLLERSASAGNHEAVRSLANLTANGTGCEADVERAKDMLRAIRFEDTGAALQLDLLEQLPSPESALTLDAKVLSADPLIFRVAELITREECDYLVTRAAPDIKPSFVINPATGGAMPHPVRTSHGSSFGPADEDLVVNNVNRRLAAITRTDPAFGEPLHILRYTPGQEYRPHLDALPGVGNQRQWTVLLYLNSGYNGGETEFPDIGVKYRGSPGYGLVFRNVAADGRPDPRTRHAGLPIVEGTKWLATRWIRGAPYQSLPD